MNRALDDLDAALRVHFPGYHLEVTLFPSGGMIEAGGCEECGTSSDTFEAGHWRFKKGQTLTSAVESLRGKLGITAVPEV